MITRQGSTTCLPIDYCAKPASCIIKRMTIFVPIAFHFGDQNNSSPTYRKFTYLFNLGIYQYEQHRLLISISFTPFKRNAYLSLLYTPKIIWRAFMLWATMAINEKLFMPFKTVIRGGVKSNLGHNLCLLRNIGKTITPSRTRFHVVVFVRFWYSLELRQIKFVVGPWWLSLEPAFYYFRNYKHLF